MDRCSTWIGFVNPVLHYISLHHTDVLIHRHLEQIILILSAPETPDLPFVFVIFPQASPLDSSHYYSGDSLMDATVMSFYYHHTIASCSHHLHYMRYTDSHLLTMLALVRYRYIASSVTTLVLDYYELFVCLVCWQQRHPNILNISMTRHGQAYRNGIEILLSKTVVQWMCVLPIHLYLCKYKLRFQMVRWSQERKIWKQV